MLTLYLWLMLIFLTKDTILRDLLIRNPMLFERTVGNVEGNNCFGMNAYCVGWFCSKNLLLAVRSNFARQWAKETTT
jgi:hypothetical protein